MTVGTMVWCIIVVTIHTFGSNTEKHDTAALGKIFKIDGEYLWVDFSEYARKQQYVGEYYSIPVKQDECTIKPLTP